VSDKSEWGFRQGRGPIITRRVNGQLIEEPLIAQREEEVIDDLLEGITRREASGGGGLSGFGKAAHASGNQSKEAGPRDLTTIPHGGLHFDEPDSDLLFQPDTTPPREEGDFVDTDAPKRRNETDQSANPEDAWDLDFLEDYNDREREKGHGTPPFFDRSGSVDESDANLDDEIDNLFK